MLCPFSFIFFQLLFTVHRLPYSGLRFFLHPVSWIMDLGKPSKKIEEHPRDLGAAEVLHPSKCFGKTDIMVMKRHAHTKFF
jgi:hypothetical protein